MKFSQHGPDIPPHLLEETIAGNVVFLCGSGVSRVAGFDDFENLTNGIYDRLGLTANEAEQYSLGEGRYEEALGSLSRRLANNRALYEAVSLELNADSVTNLSAHTTILRLSSDFEGKSVVITTNFDTLFERSLTQKEDGDVRNKSFASAQLPAPGGPRFEGIIHLHGRLSDSSLRVFVENGGKPFVQS